MSEMITSSLGGMGNAALPYPNQIPAFDSLKKLDYLLIQHFHAAPAEGLADAIFVVGAVDVDVALVAIVAGTGVVAGFEASQAEDATGDEITLGFLAGIEGEMFAGGHATFEDHALGLVGADRVGNGVEPCRSAVGIGLAGVRLE